MASNRIEIEIEGWPEALWVMRAAMARILREAADAESSPFVAKRLREIADDFEAGQGFNGPSQ